MVEARPLWVRHANNWRVKFQIEHSSLELYSPIIGEARQLLTSKIPENYVQFGTLLACSSVSVA